MRIGEILFATRIIIMLPSMWNGFFLSTTIGENVFFSDTCMTCPQNFTASAGSTSVADCTCAAGFFGPPGGPCQPCPAGTYKATYGSATTCTPCPKDREYSPTRSISLDDCMVKPK